MLTFWRAEIGKPFWLGLLSVACLVFLALPLKAHADNVVQGFAEQGKLQPGWIVALTDKSATTVEAAPAQDPSRIYGVVINPGQASITLNRSGQQVFVANAGDYPVLVSAVNGPISPGDYISMSNTDGIGAKALPDQNGILGQAINGFDGEKNVLTGSGSSAVGRINVAINPGSNLGSKRQLAVPEPLRRAAETIAGHPVSSARIWAATIVFVVAGIIAIILLVVGVRTGLTAIGRNPLSRHSILYGLFQVIGMALMIFIVGLFGVYLLLRL